MGAWVNENSIFMCDIKTMDFSPLVVYFAVQKYTLCRKLLLPFGKILNGKYASGVFLQLCDNQTVA